MREVAPPAGKLKKAKVKTGGNYRADIAWLDAMAEAGMLYSVDKTTPRPPEMTYDIHYQWDGEAEALDLDFFEQFRYHPRNCNGTAYIRDETGMYVVDNDWIRLTRPCLRMPSKGVNVCMVHGAKIPVVKAAAQRRLAEASEMVAMRLIGLTDSVDERSEPIAHKDRISASNSVLDRAGIKGGLEVEIHASGFQGVLSDLFGGEGDNDGQ